MHTWPWAALTATLWLLPIAGAFAWLGRSATVRLPSGPSATISAGLLMFAVATIVSAWLSPFAAQALARCWPTLGGIALFFIVCEWLDASSATSATRRAWIARGLAWSGLALVAVIFGSWIHDLWPASPWGHRNEYPFGHSNYTAGFSVAVLPWLGARFAATRGPARFGWGAGIVVGLLAVASTGSRGGAIAIVAIMVFVSAVALRLAAWPAWRKWSLTGALILLVAAVVLANPRLRELVLRRQWSDLAAESNRQRSAMVAAGVELGLQRPITGWGPGSVPLAYPRVRAKLDGGVDNVLQLHSTPLQIWATLGGVGVIAALIIFTGWMVAIGRTIAAQPIDATRFAAASATVGYAVVALTDHQLDVPILTALLAVNAATLVAGARDPRSVTMRHPSRVALLTAVVVLISGPLLALGRDLLARRSFEQALVAWEHGRGSEMFNALDRATKLTPRDPFFQHQAAAELLRESERATADQRRALRRAAVERLEASLRTGVHEEFAHFNLGWLQLELGSPAEAASHFRAAAALVPDKGGVYFGLGLALEQSGAQGAALRAYALEWLNDPRSAFAPTWELPRFAALRPAVQSEVLRLYDDLTAKYPPATAAAAWFRWWLGESSRPPPPPRAFSAASRQFSESWATVQARGAVTSDAHWAELYSAWRQSSPAGFLTPANGDRNFAAALARRAARHADNFRDFLIAGTEDEPALLRTLSRERTGYGVLALHPDGPRLHDVFIVQENRVIADFVSPLLPAKGWLPGRFLLALLPLEQR